MTTDQQRERAETPPTPQERLDGLYTRATEGEWLWYNGCSWWRLGLAHDQSLHDAIITPRRDKDGHLNLTVREYDRQFIAEAHNLWPTLSAELTALRVERARLREALGKFGDHAQLCSSYSSDDTRVVGCDCGFVAALTTEVP